MGQRVYAGFWIRTLAHVIDTILVSIILVPVMLLFLGAGQPELSVSSFVIQILLPAVAVVLFWQYRAATPGKQLLKLKIISIESGRAPSLTQNVGRYFAYIVAAVPLCLGFLWIVFDDNKQGWHDKLAGTAVVKAAP